MRSIATCIVGLTLAVNLGVGCGLKLVPVGDLLRSPWSPCSTSPDVRQKQPHRFQVDDVVQDYSQAIPASQTCAALIREPGDTFARAYWNISQESQSHGYDRRWDAGPRYP